MRIRERTARIYQRQAMQQGNVKLTEIDDLKKQVEELQKLNIHLTDLNENLIIQLRKTLVRLRESSPCMFPKIP